MRYRYDTCGFLIYLLVVGWCVKSIPPKMGVVLGIEAAEAVVEGVEVAESVEAGVEVAEVGLELGEVAEGGAAAGEEAETAVETITRYLTKIEKWVEGQIKGYYEFKFMNEVIETVYMNVTDPGEKERLRDRQIKIRKTTMVLQEAGLLQRRLYTWMKIHKTDEVQLHGGFTVNVVSGILAKPLKEFGKVSRYAFFFLNYFSLWQQAAQQINILSAQVKKQNGDNKPMSDEQVEKMRDATKAILESFLTLAEFKDKNSDKIGITLMSLPFQSILIKTYIKQLD